MKVRIVNVDIENVVKGKSRYSKATVAYLFNGEARTQNIMSFVNPDVFKTVQESVGQEVEVTVTKNDAGYNQWSAVSPAGSGGGAPTPSAAPAAPASRSNYETAEERANRQVYIVKQSSLANALTYMELTKSKPTPEEVTALAQQFTDWVFGKDASLESLQSDI